MQHHKEEGQAIAVEAFNVEKIEAVSRPRNKCKSGQVRLEKGTSRYAPATYCSFTERPAATLLLPSAQLDTSPCFSVRHGHQIIGEREMQVEGATSPADTRVIHCFIMKLAFLDISSRPVALQ